MSHLDITECTRRLEAIGKRICSNPSSPFGMPGVSLFAEDISGTRVSVFVGQDAWGTSLTAENTICLASVGKLAIALLVLRLVDRGVVSLDDALARISGRITGDVGQATLRDALSHRADIPSILSESQVPYDTSLTALRIRACFRGLDRLPARTRRIQYSDVAYGLLAEVIESGYGKPFAECLGELNDALGTRLSIGVPLPDGYIRVIGIPTPHLHTEIEPLNSAFWHSLALPWAAVRGAPDDGIKLVRAFAKNSPVLSASLQTEAIVDPDAGALSGGIPLSQGQLGMDSTPSLDWEPCGWGLGVELSMNKTPHWTPREAHASSFGHVGISGTLAWHDPTVGLSWAMAGTRSSHSGWLLRYGPMLGKAVLQSIA